MRPTIRTFRKIGISDREQRGRKMTAGERDAGLKRHRKNALIKEGSCGNEPGDAVSDSMRNSQDGSFHYSGRSKVSLPQVDLEPTEERTIGCRLTVACERTLRRSTPYTHALRLHVQRADRRINILLSLRNTK